MNKKNIYRIKFRCRIPPPYGNCCLHLKIHPLIVQCIMSNFTIYVDNVSTIYFGNLASEVFFPFVL